MDACVGSRSLRAGLVFRSPQLSAPRDPGRHRRCSSSYNRLCARLFLNHPSAFSSAPVSRFLACKELRVQGGLSTPTCQSPAKPEHKAGRRQPQRQPTRLCTTPDGGHPKTLRARPPIRLELPVRVCRCCRVCQGLKLCLIFLRTKRRRRYAGDAMRCAQR